MGHNGINLTLQLLRSIDFEWSRMAKDIFSVIAKCEFCQKDRLTQPEAAAVLGQLQAYALFEELSRDFI